VRFIATRDDGCFRFGASQSDAARTLLSRFGIDRETARSIILIEQDTVYLHSDAVLRIASRMRAPWKYAAVLRVVPRPIRDAVYRVIAAVRHRLAGRSNACEIPPAEIRSRLITP
jgi:predicted DCC family thiol-disulfide oxidoreductase YuxK